jgi:hypothetical protein
VRCNLTFLFIVCVAVLLSVCIVLNIQFEPVKQTEQQR